MDGGGGIKYTKRKTSNSKNITERKREDAVSKKTHKNPPISFDSCHSKSDICSNASSLQQNCFLHDTVSLEEINRHTSTQTISSTGKMICLHQSACAPDASYARKFF
ncbi:hypothetical protein GOODEAATRI_017128 [Goodea atripinnis]|uniref:Cycloidea-like protein A n=1 Tax=Goodea atripinnis TaxID=208336 RepID=A0ABV0PQ01_9TELE